MTFSSSKSHQILNRIQFFVFTFSYRHLEYAAQRTCILSIHRIQEPVAEEGPLFRGGKATTVHAWLKEYRKINNQNQLQKNIFQRKFTQFGNG